MKEISRIEPTLSSGRKYENKGEGGIFPSKDLPNKLSDQRLYCIRKHLYSFTNFGLCMCSGNGDSN